MQTTKLILASQSPRRRELLLQHGYDFEVIPPSPTAESDANVNEAPTDLVARLAFEKARDVATNLSSGLVLGSDTVAECNGQILGKPTNRDHAKQMLTLMQGMPHRVLSGVCLWKRPDDLVLVEVDETDLLMDRFSEVDLEEYLDTNGWEGKAGAFGYQDGLDWVHIVKGSESNVVGLPMEKLADMLKRFPKVAKSAVS